jgi:hypothetical protein
MDLSSMAPGDAAVALRSFPRRFRAPFIGPDPDQLTELATRPGADGRSALDRVLAAARTLWAAARDLAAVLVYDMPPIGAAPAAHGGPRAALADGEDVATSLESAVEQTGRAAVALAERVERAPADAWSREGRRPDGRRVTAQRLVADAVAEAVADLRAAEQNMAEAGRRGDD